MSNAKKCDRCGAFYEEYEGVQLVDGGCYYDTLSIFGFGKSKCYDLCESCMKSLIEWIKNEKV